VLQRCPSFFISSGVKEYFDLRVEKKIAQEFRNPIIFHCASFGEYQSIKPLLKEIRRHSPTLELVISFFSPSGYNNLKPGDLFDYKIYSPIDTYKNVSEWLHHLHPRAIVVSQNEIWPRFIQISKQLSISTVFVDSSFNNTLSKRILLKLMRPLLKNVSIFFVTNNVTSELLTNYQLKNYLLPQTLRKEEVQSTLSNLSPLPQLEQMKKDKPLLILASIHRSDFHLFENSLDRISEIYNILIAPHDINSHEINSIIRLLDIRSYSLYSDKKLGPKSICILDNFGVLKNAYRYADIVYIGGGFEKGIHNVLEVAIYKKPIIVGPRFTKFIEALNLEKIGVLYSVENSATFLTTIKHIRSRGPEYYLNAYPQEEEISLRPSKFILQYLKEHQII